MNAPKLEAHAVERAAFDVLMALVAQVGPEAPELELMLAAIRTGLPGFVEATLHASDERHAAHRSKLAQREAERELAGAHGPFPAVVVRIAWWAAWLDAGGREAIDAWRPIATTPELVDGVWWCVGPDGEVLGVGESPTAAHLEANRTSLAEISDPTAAGQMFDFIPSGDPMLEMAYPAVRVRFMHVRGSVPNLATSVGQALTGYLP